MDAVVPAREVVPLEGGDEQQLRDRQRQQREVEADGPQGDPGPKAQAQALSDVLLAAKLRAKKTPGVAAQRLHGVAREPEPDRRRSGRDREQEHDLGGEEEGRDVHVPGTSPPGSA